MDDPKSLNLRLELDLAGILPQLTAPAAATPASATPPAAAALSSGAAPSSGATATTEADAAAASPRVRQARARVAQSKSARPPVVDPTPASLFEGWLQQMRSLFSPVFLSLGPDGKQLLPGLGGVPQPSATPLLFVGNHQLYGFDGPLIVEELLRERGQLVAIQRFQT